LSALTVWVEKGKAPDAVIATKYDSDNPQLGIQMQRPICVFPKVPEYEGKGSPDLPTSFERVADKPADFNNEKPAKQYGP